MNWQNEKFTLYKCFMRLWRHGGRDLKAYGALGIPFERPSCSKCF